MSRRSSSILVLPMSPSGSVSTCGSSVAGDMDTERRGKKRRLDHLTNEEKMQRKKLKNRVAAQTSRDRKKMKMDEMESNLDQLSDENQKLRKDFKALEATNQTLRSQNQSLQKQLEVLRQRLDDQEARLVEKERQLQQQETSRRMDSSASSVADIALKPGSAASTDVDPQQQGLSATQQKKMKRTSSSPVWQVIALCLLYKISSSSRAADKENNIPQQEQDLLQPLTFTAGKSWPKVYSQISHAKWQAMLKEAAMRLPRMQAPYHSCLDSWWGPEQSAWNPVAKVEA